MLEEGGRGSVCFQPRHDLLLTARANMLKTAYYIKVLQSEQVQITADSLSIGPHECMTVVRRQKLCGDIITLTDEIPTECFRLQDFQHVNLMHRNFAKETEKCHQRLIAFGILMSNFAMNSN